MDDKADDSPEGQESLLSQLAEDFQYEVRPLAIATAVWQLNEGHGSGLPGL